MKIAPLATLLCVLPLAGCYVVQYPGGALTLSPTPDAPQALRAAPGSIGNADVTTAPVPTPNVAAAPVRSTPMPPPPAGTAARQSSPPVYPNGSPVPPDYQPGDGSPVPPDYRPAVQPARTPYPNYPNGSPVPPDYVPPPGAQVPSGTLAYSPDPGYAAYPTYATYAPYPAYSAYSTYPVYPAYAPIYPAFAPSPWLGNVSFSVSWGRDWGGWGGRCCHRWR